MLLFRVIRLFRVDSIRDKSGEKMVIDQIKNRYSVRAFEKREIEPEILDNILKAAQLAPSARNFQPWKFVVITDELKRAKLTEIAKGQKFVAEAPVTIAVCANNMDYRMSCGHQASIIDAAIAAEHIVLQAVHHGLGSCWIGAFHQEMIGELLEIPKEYSVIALLPLGYPSISRRNRILKENSEVISYNKF